LKQSSSKRHPTMIDVANLAGVSQTTVSFVVNNISGLAIPQETRERVRAAVKQLGYRPNAAAQLLRTSKSHVIGFITDQVDSTPFSGEFITGAQGAAWTHQKLLLMVNTGGKPAIEEEAIELMLERRVEGIIYAAMIQQLVTPPANLWEVPAVLLNCFCADRSLPSVVPDEVRGGCVATEALLRKGHRRVAFINGPAGWPPTDGRLAGYRQALEALDLTVDESLVRHGNGFADSGYAHTMDVMGLPNPPTAIFCATDRMAMGAYDALKELGLSIPGNVAVMGYDNQELIGAYLRPSLSTMALPFFGMGQWAVSYLIHYERHAGQHAPVQHLIECPFIERESI